MAEDSTTSDSMTPAALLAALGHIRPDLPALLGDPAWQREGPALLARIDALAACDDPAQARRLAVEIVKAVAAHPLARQRLNRELLLLADLRRVVTPELRGLADELASSQAQTASALSAALALLTIEHTRPENGEGITRTLYTDSGGVGGGEIVRLRHLQFDAGELAELLAGAVMTGVDVAGTPHPLVILAGLLLVARSLQKIVSVDVNEELTTVYWGLFHACGRPDRCASVAEITVTSNSTRERYGRLALGEVYVGRVLADLARLHLAEPCDSAGDTWRFLERIELG